jgi:acyl-coenzyme A thioesterase PaaI-like protein
MPSDHSTHILKAHDGKAVARLSVGADLPPVAASGAVLTLGNAAAFAAATSALERAGTAAPGRVPVPLQLSVNLFHPTERGTLTAEAETIYRGRTSLIVDVKVRDDRTRLIAALVVTQLASFPAAALTSRAPAWLAS